MPVNLLGSTFPAYFVKHTGQSRDGLECGKETSLFTRHTYKALVYRCCLYLSTVFVAQKCLKQDQARWDGAPGSQPPFSSAVHVLLPSTRWPLLPALVSPPISSEREGPRFLLCQHISLYHLVFTASCCLTLL